MVISVNKIRCNACEDVIESTHVHDFKWCKCMSVFVDGGPEYLRRGGQGLDLKGYTEMSEHHTTEGGDRRTNESSD